MIRIRNHTRHPLNACHSDLALWWADGIGNYFYSMWRDAVNGKSEYEAVFVPWFWQSEYSIEPPEDFEYDDDEEDYQELVSNYFLKIIYQSQLQQTKIHYKTISIQI